MVIYSSVEQKLTQYGRVVELVDSLDSGSSVHYGRAGSSPASRTKKADTHLGICFFLAPVGLERTAERSEATKCPGDTWLVRGKVHLSQSAVRRTVNWDKYYGSNQTDILLDICSFSYAAGLERTARPDHSPSLNLSKKQIPFWYLLFYSLNSNNLLGGTSSASASLKRTSKETLTLPSSIELT